jgi:hypothetical protein
VPVNQIDFILGSWIHCELPTGGGGALNITSLSAYLNPSTDAPNFLFELIQSSPTSLKGHIDTVAKEVLGIWFDQCACGEREVGETERASLEKFGPEVAERVLGSVREFFTA